MGGEICFRKGYEKGPWFEIKCLRNDILNKESRGADASFGRHLLESWAKYPWYEKAGDVLKALSPPIKATEGDSATAQVNDILPPAHGGSPDFDVTQVVKQKGGCPRITGGEMSRSTAWRREKEGERVMV